jgi:CNT family concentrative nucleoside transporter
LNTIGAVAFGLFGLATLIAIAFAFSNNKRAVDWRLVVTGVVLQILFASFVLLAPGGREIFDALGRGFVKLLEFTREGSAFIFGDLARSSASSSRSRCCRPSSSSRR